MSEEKKSFEELLARLEEISSLMNNEKTSLEQSLELFKEGGQIAQTAQKMLEDAKLSIATYKGGE